MSTGLVLGKFAPLHKGHEYVIGKAIQENNLVYVLIYDCPEVTDVPLPIRANWIRQSCAGCNSKLVIIECWDGNNTVSNDPKIKKQHETYIRSKLKGIKIDNFYSSEFYGAHISKALGAKDCRVDEARKKFPISGTKIRENPYKYRKYLSPYVYRDLITRILFVGAPSTGKSTLCKALAKKYDTVWMPEYGRNYWARFNKNRRLTLEQLDTIALTHRTMMLKKVNDANKYLFVDTDASTTQIFAKYYHGESTPILHNLTRLSRLDYDYVFLCDDDIPYEDTKDRSGEANRDLFQRQIKADLFFRRIRFAEISGSLASRIYQVERILIENYQNRRWKY